MENKKGIDARGLACPQPVIMARKALAEVASVELTVLIDNDTARENILRLAASLGYDAAASGQGQDQSVVIKKHTGDVDLGQAIIIDDCQIVSKNTGGICIFATSEYLGSGSDELGRLLMKSFFYALSEREVLPTSIALMNGGVKLAVENSPALTDLKAMVAGGVRLLVCGTCLDYYGLKDQLAVGLVSNMYDIQEALLAADQILRP